MMLGKRVKNVWIAHWRLIQPAHRVMDAEDAYITHYLLTQVVKHGTAARARSLGHPAAGKTGTTNDSFDTWFVGYTKSLVASVWVGYDSMKYPLAVREQGGRTALPIWLDFMKKSLRRPKTNELETPIRHLARFLDRQSNWLSPH